MAPMRPVQTQVKEIFALALSKAFPSVDQEPALVKGNPKLGDFQCNNAMSLYKDYGKALGFSSPAAIAEAIKAALPENDILGEVTVAGGFVNVKISLSWITKNVQGILESDISYEDLPKKRVVVDFSSPNIAKEMHVGHLRSTIIGESTCRILEFCGHEVHRLNHVGDWGTQFGMLIEYVKEAFPDFQESLPQVSDLQEFYKAAKGRFDEDEEFKKRAQLSVVALQNGDAFATSAWQQICEVSRQAFQKIYDRLKITLEERGESFYNPMIAPLVEDLKARQISVESNGAMCIFTPSVAEIPLMMVKSDGGYGYDSTDMAAIYHRLVIMRADWVVYVTDMGQATHFHMLFDAAKQAGWHHQGVTRCDHMGFGVVQGEDKKRLKSRSGDTVKLQELLDEAVDRAYQEIVRRVDEQTQKGEEVFMQTEEEQGEAAETIGIAAVRYFDMKHNRLSPYVFNYDRMLDPKGNSALYLFYAYARICSIEQKCGFASCTSSASALQIAHPAERELALKLLLFPDVIGDILAKLELHRLTDYLWELCKTFTEFHAKCKVWNAEEQESRLLLCEATRKILHKSFFLLGFQPLERI
mmetsp:Transcript_23182/g.42675  ORF Transcript_23182/g.42675 Transcript_23182/m.42675 type:complete len:585 (+) Transcript_23182:75-1829(+)